MPMMTLATARNVADTPPVGAVGMRMTQERLVEAKETIYQRGHGDGRDARRVAGLTATIERRERLIAIARERAAVRQVPEPMTADEFREVLNAREWDRENGYASHQWM